MTKDDVPHRFAVDFAGATLLGIYRVERKIADGGMGSVWLGEDTNLGRRVVVKVPHVRFLGESGFRARFAREIAELVRLEHPHIVRILAQGTHEEIPFFVLQYLGGGSLEDRLAAGPRGVDAVAPWLRTIAATLDFVHGRGVVHRDVKPENILFDEAGHVFLSDFGVVKALDENLDVTEAGTGVGSPKYMAPEQGLGKPVDGAADQYGLATTVYEAIAGRLPFAGDSALQMLLNKQKEAPTPLAGLAPDLPAACAAAVMRGLSRDPAERFPSCGDFADAFLAGAGILDRTPPGGVPVAARRRGRFAVVAAALFLAAAAYWFAGRTPPPDEPSPGVVLLSPGGEPRRVLRYRPALGAKESIVVGVETEQSKRLGDEAPVVVTLPRVRMGLRLEVTDVARNGDVSFAWESTETTLDAGEGAPPPVAEALGRISRSLGERSGTALQSECGVNREVRHDEPPPEEPGAQPLVALIHEMVSQVSTPLPEEPVGVGARWEVTKAADHIEGIRLTQTVIYELRSLGENEARLRMYVVVAALNQELALPGIPAEANARLKSVHGDGEGELVIDFDRLGDRSLRMTVESQAKLSVTAGDATTELTVGRKIRFESERE